MNSLDLAALHDVIHKGASPGSGASPRLWSKLRNGLLSADGACRGKLMGDDFTNVGALISTAEPHGYEVYADTGGTITPRADACGGVVVASGTTDEHQTLLQGAGGVGGQAVISDTAADQKLTIFETRWTPSEVADDTLATFAGLGIPGLCADGTLVSGAMKDTSYIGFNQKHADGDVLEFVYRIAGGAEQTFDVIDTIVAGQAYNIGFVFDPKQIPSKRIAVFVDNVEQSTYVTQANLEAATFPDDLWMSLLLGVQAGDGSATSAKFDWWSLYQGI